MKWLFLKKDFSALETILYGVVMALVVKNEMTFLGTAGLFGLWWMYSILHNALFDSEGNWK